MPVLWPTDPTTSGAGAVRTWRNRRWLRRVCRRCSCFLPLVCPARLPEPHAEWQAWVHDNGLAAGMFRRRDEFRGHQEDKMGLMDILNTHSNSGQRSAHPSAPTGPGTSQAGRARACRRSPRRCWRCSRSTPEKHATRRLGAEPAGRTARPTPMPACPAAARPGGGGGGLAGSAARHPRRRARRRRGRHGAQWRARRAAQAVPGERPGRRGAFVDRHRAEQDDLRGRPRERARGRHAQHAVAADRDGTRRPARKGCGSISPASSISSRPTGACRTRTKRSGWSEATGRRGRARVPAPTCAAGRQPAPRS